MLVLSRKNRETVVIDGRITVKVLQIKGNTIRLGIDAPTDMSIRRGELIETVEITLPLEAPEKEGSSPLTGETAPTISYTCAAS